MKSRERWAHTMGIRKYSFSRTVVFILILAFYGSLLLHKIDLPAADDLPRHIQNGAMLLQGNTDVLYKNLYSYTEGNYAVTNHHWLSGVVFYVLERLFGFGGLVIFKILVLLAAFCLLFAAALKKADFWLVVALAIPSILVLRERTGLRPEIFSYLFIALFLYLLLDLEEHPQHQRMFWLIPIQMLWVNLHIFSSIGIALVAVFLLEKLRNPDLDRKLSLLLLGVIVATLINPYGPKIFYVFYWAINANKDFPIGTMEEYSVPEFLKFSTPAEDISVAVFGLMALLMLVSFIPAIKRKPIFYFLTGVSTIVVAFSRLRGFAFFGMMALPIISANLNGPYVRVREKIKDTWASYATAAGALLQVVLISSLAYLLVIAVQGKISWQNEFGIGLTFFSASSSAFLKDNNISGPVFNDPDIGSYLIGSRYPQEKVFVDNRFADAYPPSFFKDSYLPLLSDESKWLEAMKRYDFNAIVVYQYDGTENLRTFIRRRIYDPGWSFVYVDPYAFILLRNKAANSETIQKFAMTPNNIRQKMQNLIQSDNPREQIGAADIFSVVGMPDEALEIFSNVIQRWPERNNLWLVMGQTELSKAKSSNPAQALAYLEKAIDGGYKTAQAYALLGLAYSQMGEKENALKSLEQALRLDPSRNDARELLERVKGALHKLPN
jgi:tetratricopeptide (TPR) repeat protein